MNKVLFGGLISIALCAAVYSGMTGLVPGMFGSATVASGPGAPVMINHQGVVSVNGTRFTGTASFKFAIINTDTGLNLWTNDNTQVGTSNPPIASIALSVADGIYSSALGSTGMAALPATVFIENSNTALRVWFNDGNHGDQQLSPDQKLGSVPYAVAIADGSVGAAKLAGDVAIVPVGTVVATARDAAPSGWLICDGSAVSRTGYADLFAAIGTRYGSGDGSTTFALPDLQQRFPIGKGSSGTAAVLGETGGTLDYVHQHPLSSRGAAQITIAAVSSKQILIKRYDPPNTPNWTPSHAGTGLSVGAPDAGTQASGATLMGVTDDTESAYNPPFIALHYMIKY